MSDGPATIAAVVDQARQEVSAAVHEAFQRMEIRLAALEGSGADSAGSAKPAAPRSMSRAPRVRDFRVQYRGRTCKFGDTLAYKVLKILMHGTGHYVHTKELAQAWPAGKRESSNVRQQVFCLRKKLRSAGMEGLAGAIEGIPHYYRVRPIWERN